MTQTLAQADRHLYDLPSCAQSYPQNLVEARDLPGSDYQAIITTIIIPVFLAVFCVFRLLAARIRRLSGRREKLSSCAKIDTYGLR